MKRALASLAAVAVAAGCQHTASTETPAAEASETGANVASQARQNSLETGLKLLKVNQPEMALVAFQRSVAEDGVSSSALTGMGLSLYRMGRKKEAKQFLVASVDIDPNDPITRNALGVVHYGEGDYATAVAEFEKAYALTDGLDQSIATNLGMAEFALAGDPEAQPFVDDADYDVIQYGHGVYRLEPRAKSAASDGPGAGNET